MLKLVWLFSFQPLLGVHRKFYGELQLAINKGSPKLADVFIRYKTEMVVYGEFCANLPRAQRHIDELCQNEPFRTKIQVKYLFDTRH